MMNFSYNYQFPIEDIMESLAAAGSINSVVSSIFGLAAYVFTALSLYTIAQRRGIRKAWLAWIPVVNVWILGSISDQFRYVVKAENKSKRKALLILNLISAAITVAVVVIFFVMFINMFILALNNGTDEMIFRQILLPAMGMLGLSVLLLGFSIAYAIIYYMALYDLYTSCEPGNNVLYLVLSIIPVVSSVALPLLLFLCREKDGGMPPRRELPKYDAPPTGWQEEAYQAKQEWREEAPLWKSEPENTSDPWNRPNDQ